MGLVPPPILPTSVPILDIAGLGKVEADLANQKLVFTCANPGEVPLEYSILAGGSYSQSEAGGWGSLEVTPAVKKETLPHYQTFLVTIARYEKIGVALCRENDGVLAVIKLYEGSSPTGSKLLDIAGLGKVEADLANQKLVFTCANPGEVPLEYSILAGGNYSQSEAGGWGSSEVTPAVKKETLPHYQTFLVTIARYEKIGVALCRENDGVLAFCRLGEYVGDLTPTPVLNIAGLGKCEADLANQKLVFTCANPGEVPLEYSILAGGNYSQSEAGGWGSSEVTPAVKKETLPHYQTFLVTIARYESLGAAICRENDGRLAVLQLKSVLPSPTPTPTSAEPRITLIQPKGGETLVAGDSYEILWVTLNSPRLPNQVRIQFSSNGGTDWTPVATAPNNGTFSWSVPQVGTTEARIRLIWEGSQNLQTIAEEFGNNFTIALRPHGLVIQKLATQDSVAAGDTITFNLLVSNSGDQSLYLVQVTDPLPAGTTFVEAPATVSGLEGSFDAGSGLVVWELGNLNPGDWKLLRLVLKAQLGTPDGTVIHNKALAHSGRPQLSAESQDEIVVVGSKIHEAYIKGYTGDLGVTFGPQRNVSRGEIAAIIARLLHLQSTVTGQQFYSDVPANHWTFKYVEAVHRLGIMTGFPDGTFRPDDPATRANVAVAMIRARGIDPVAFLPAAPFSDISGHWAIKEIETAYVLRIIEGLPDGTFHPDAPIVRAETVTLIDRALGRGPLLEGSVIQHFSDCQPSDWFYGWGEESFQSHKGVRMASGNERLLEYLDTGPVW
jgi:uncharacterized repeat protein (TIGR01451 family)